MKRIKTIKTIHKLIILTVAILPVAELLKLFNHGSGY
jgi:hypothetical protein